MIYNYGYILVIKSSEKPLSVIVSTVIKGHFKYCLPVFFCVVLIYE